MTPHEQRSDIDILNAYGRDGDESAFEVLAARHVDMIFAVSLRRSGNRQLAEEATQNVLIALSRNARNFTAPGSNLTAWLHTSTKFEIAKLQRREARIKKREQAYATETMNTSTPDEDETFLRLLPLLDRAIDQLRTPDREVIVRRYLEGQDFRRIGDALGISEDAAQKRTSRAFEALNRFFKRKAGVTVSTTALAAGIGQHCAEAAPAACLHFTASAATTGLASILTTASITTMSTLKITAIAAGVIAVAGTIALIATHSPTEPQTVSASPPPSPTPRTPATPQPSGATIAARTDGTATPAPTAEPDSANEELARLEAMSPHPSQDEMARRLSVKHGQLLNDLTADLGLSDTQAAALKNILEIRLKAFRASLDPEPGADVSPEAAEKAMLTKAGGLIRGTGLRDDLTAILSEPQLAAFDERENKAWQSQVESLSYLELSKLTPVLKLSEDQKDKVFGLLQTSSAEDLQQSSDARAFMALMQNKTTTQVDFTSMADAEFFHEIMDGPNALSPDSPEAKKRIRDFVIGQSDQKVERLASVLDPDQKQRYRDHLISKSILPMLGIELPTHEEK